MGQNCAVAIIENGTITIRVPINNLAAIVEGAWASGALDMRFKVTDEDAFARDLIGELNREEEDGTTPIHRLLDAMINEALESGGEGIEEHEDQGEDGED